MSQGTQTQEQRTPGQNDHFKPSTALRNWLARIFIGVVFVATIIGIVVLAVLLVDVLVTGWPGLSWDFITNFPSFVSPEIAGILPGLLGSMWLIVLTALFAVPLGVGAAIYLEEYAEDTWINRIVEINIANLAGVPSIIYGLLGLAIFVGYLGPLTGGKSILSGALTLSLLILPVIIISAREAIRTVPDTVREGAFALGASRWQAIRDHVLPMSLPGALTGTILALSRALGETAPLIVIGAATYLTFNPEGPRSNFTALPMLIYSYVSQPNQEFQETIAAAGIIVLMVLLLVMNSSAIILRNRWQKRS
ncbi:phosphate ABC transporter permease PstA [soil metagenome]